MVTNVYSNIFLPKIKKYNINPNQKNFNNSSSSVDPDASNGNSKNLQESNNHNNDRCVNKFLSADSSEINISDIIKDFKGTMTQLGIPKAVGMSIMEDLKNIHVQASTETPSISQIQNNLYKAAAKVDDFVSETIGKESQVVKQWVDALLFQKINYYADDPLSQDVIDKALAEKQQTILTNNDNSNSNNNNTGIDQQKTSVNKLARIADIDLAPQEATLKTSISIEVNDPKAFITDKTDLPDNVNINIPEPNINKDFSIKIDSQGNIKYTKDRAEVLETAKQLYLKAKDLYNRDSIAEAEKVYTELLPIVEGLQHKKMTATTHTKLAEISDQNNDYNTALKHYHEAIKLATELENDKMLAKLHYNVGSIYDDLNLPDQAMKHYHASLSFDGELDNLDGQAITLNNIAMIYSADQKYDQALDCYNVAYSIVSELNDSNAKAHILSNIGSLFKSQNDTNNALEYYRRSLKLDQNNNNIADSTTTLVQIGDIYDLTGQNDRAQKCYNKALFNARQLQNYYLQTLIMGKLNN